MTTMLSKFADNKGIWSTLLKPILITLMIMGFAQWAGAQCTSNNSQNSTQSANNTGNLVSWELRPGRYTTVNNLIVGRQYIVTSSLSTNFFTIRTGSAGSGGTVIATGTQPLTFTATATTAYIISSTNSSCGTSGTDRTVGIRIVPVITGLPATACIGNTFIIEGSGFNGTTGITINGVSAPTFTINSATQITVTVPAGASTGNVVVQHPAGNVTGSAPVTISNQPANASISGATTICQGDDADISVSASQNGVSYQLRNNSNNALVGSPVNGTGSAISINTGILNSTTTFNVLATNTTTGCTRQLSGTVTITVNTAAVANAGGPNDVCFTSTPAAITLSGASVGGSATTGAWSIISGGGTLSSTAQSSTPNTRTYTPANGFTGTVELRLTTNDPAGVCPAATATRIIQVNPIPDLFMLGGTTTICAGEGATIQLTGSESGVTYQLRNNANNNAVGAAVNGTGSALTLPTGNLTATTTFNILATKGSCSRQMTGTTQITVSAVPNATVSNATQSICSGQSFTTITLGTSPTVSGTTFAWTRDNVTEVTGLPASGTGNISSATLTNNTTSPVTVTITIIPTGPAPAFCEGASRTATITVRPRPVGSADAVSICSGNTTDIELNATVSGTTFTWTSSNLSGSVSGASNCSSNCGTTISQTLTSTAGGTRRYTVTPTASSCAGNTFTIDVTVNPLPTNINPGGATTICSGSSANITIANSQNGVNYQLRNNSNNALLGSPVNGTGGTINLPTGSLNATTTFNVLATNNATLCSRQMNNTVTVTVNQPYTVTPGGPDNVCVSANPAAITLSGASVGNGATQGAWTITSGGGTLSSTAMSNSPQTRTYTPPANFTGTIELTLTSNAPGVCPANSAVRYVYVNPLPTPTITPNFCIGNNKVQLSAGNYSSYAWSTGETTSSIQVDVSNLYTVTVTTSAGCTGTASYQLATELVANGNFEAGNTGFTTGYANNQTANGLVPEDRYAIGNNANFHHPNFWGRDNTTGAGNFMIVNGHTSATPAIVWQQTVTVQPNTNYYFSAWAMSLNQVSPYAQLRFSVNGVQVGTTAILGPGATNNTGPWNWTRFYATWNSGSSTSVVLTIVNLQTAAGGNDFGLDDISCSTIAPPDMTASPSTASVVCENGNLSLLANVSGGGAPYTYAWSGPGGFNSTDENPIRNNANALMSGTYELTVTDSYNCLTNASLVVDVNARPVVNPTSSSATVCNGSSVSINANATAGSGTITSYAWNSGIAGNTASGSVTPAASTTYIVTVTNSNTCSATGSTHISVKALSSAPASLTPSSPFVGCLGDGVTLTVNGGSLGDGAVWKLYASDCEGSLVAQSATNSFNVTPTNTTHYFVKAEGDCNVTICRDVLVKANQPVDVVSATTTKSCVLNGTITGEKFFVDNNNRVLLGIDEGTVDLATVEAITTVHPTTVPAMTNSAGCTQNELYIPRKFDFHTNVAQPFSAYVTMHLYFTQDEFDRLSSATQTAGTEYINCWGMVNSINDLMVTIKHSETDIETRTQFGGGLVITPVTLPDNAMLYRASFQINRFSEAFLHGNGGAHGSNPLPVSWLNFTATPVKNEFIQLNWATATEINNNGFMVERSTDGNLWSVIGWVEGNNNSTVQQNYTFDDYNVVPAVRYYYRLKQIDNDGMFEYSSIATATLTSGVTIESIKLYPNPSNGITNLVIQSAATSAVEVSLHNAIGQEVSKNTYTITQGENVLQADWSNMPVGTYYVTTRFEETTQSVKLIITRN